MGAECSLEGRRGPGAGFPSGEEGGSEERLRRLESVVAGIVERLDEGERGDGVGVGHAEGESTSPTQPPPQAPVQDLQPGMPSVAPVFVIRDVASEMGVRQQVANGMVQGPDIITRGLVGVQDAVGLIELLVSESFFIYVAVLIKADFRNITDAGFRSVKRYLLMLYSQK
jgi:hypothetical protein